MSNIICPSCDGRKGGMAFVCGPGSDGMRWMPCSTCKGTGEITVAHLERIRQSKPMRADRVSRRVTLHEEAKRLGCNMGEWSRIEAGGEPETEAGARALAARLQELQSAGA
ncbi:MAG: hypothetical protein M3416_03750 [Acidobacteriota bacterium]|nr:hypothetical protein [Acidobacteriota bacterium]